MTRALVTIAGIAVISVLVAVDAALHALRWIRTRPPLRQCRHGVDGEMSCLACVRERGAA